MKPKLRILLIEDNVADAELIQHQLKEAGFAFRLSRIHTEVELRRELETPPDLILSDHGLPSFSGFEALEIVRENHPELPFVFVSGSNDQGMVAKMYDEGATDYVFKRDINDLKPAVLRALSPQPAAPPPETEPNGISTPVSAALSQSASASTIGHLSFCPQCRQTRDAAGCPVLMENYFDSYAEIVILRQICAECNPSC